MISTKIFMPYEDLKSNKNKGVEMFNTSIL